MGRIHEKLQNREEAIRSYQAAVRSNSDPDMVRLASESLELLSR